MSEEHELVEKMRQMIQQMVGRRLPSERELAARWNISRPRLRAILATFQQEGLVESRSKSGTYVVDSGAARLRRVVLSIDTALKLGDDPFFSLLVDSLQRSIQEAGALCVIARTDSREGLPTGDGILTLGLMGQTLLQQRRPSDPPLVGLLLGPNAAPSRRASVFQLADREAGQAAAEFLLNKGCRHITFLGRHDLPASQERLAGAEAAIAAGQADLRFVGSHLNYADGLRLGSRLEWPQTPNPVGIIAANDWLAVGLRAGLRQRGDLMGQTVLIVSFDGLPIVAETDLGIHSLAVPIATIAADAVAELDRLLRSPGAAGRTIRYPLTWAASEFALAP